MIKLFLLSCVFASTYSSAAVVQLIDSVGGVIPDGSLAGFSSSLDLVRPGEEISSITVDLGISSTEVNQAFLGDLYLYLTDGVTLVTLINRPGRDSNRPDGYDDNQSMNITFSDAASLDVHTYRPDANTPLTGPLAGSFQPDGRTTDPTSVVTSDLRLTQLSDFSGLSAERTFTLFAADLSTGAEHQIESWTLNIITVPEPSQGIFLCCGMVTLLIRRKRICACE